MGGPVGGLPVQWPGGPGVGAASLRLRLAGHRDPGALARHGTLNSDSEPACGLTPAEARGQIFRRRPTGHKFMALYCLVPSQYLLARGYKLGRGGPGCQWHAKPEAAQDNFR